MAKNQVQQSSTFVPPVRKKAPALAPAPHAVPQSVVAASAESSGLLPVQAKLTLGAVGDRYEQEADATAKQVVQAINSPAVQTKSALPQPVGRNLTVSPLAGVMQAQGAMGGGAVAADVETGIQRAKGGGQALDAGLQESMGQAMGADFSGVRIHTNGQSDQLNTAIQAKAFTTGQDVFFRQGEYNPGSSAGQELIAHELTHVVQQSGHSSGLVQRKGNVMSTTDFEKETHANSFLFFGTADREYEIVKVDDALKEYHERQQPYKDYFFQSETNRTAEKRLEYAKIQYGIHFDLLQACNQYFSVSDRNKDRDKGVKTLEKQANEKFKEAAEEIKRYTEELAVQKKYGKSEEEKPKENPQSSEQPESTTKEDAQGYIKGQLGKELMDMERFELGAKNKKKYNTLRIILERYHDFREKHCDYLELKNVQRLISMLDSIKEECKVCHQTSSESNELAHDLKKQAEQKATALRDLEYMLKKRAEKAKATADSTETAQDNKQDKSKSTKQSKSSSSESDGQSAVVSHENFSKIQNKLLVEDTRINTYSDNLPDVVKELAKDIESYHYLRHRYLESNEGLNTDTLQKNLTADDKVRVMDDLLHHLKLVYNTAQSFRKSLGRELEHEEDSIWVRQESRIDVIISGAKVDWQSLNVLKANFQRELAEEDKFNTFFTTQTLPSTETFLTSVGVKDLNNPPAVYVELVECLNVYNQMKQKFIINKSPLEEHILKAIASWLDGVAGETDKLIAYQKKICNQSTNKHEKYIKEDQDKLKTINAFYGDVRSERRMLSLVKVS